MKKFILKAIVFMIASFLVLNVLGYFLIESRYFSKQLEWAGIREMVKKGKKKLPTEIIFLGDSVGRQLFPRDLPGSLVCNAAVLTVGHYILACSAVEKNKQLKYIVLASLPHVLAYKFERPLTYRYFMKPFYTFENLKYISNRTLKKIDKKKLAHFAIFPFVKAAACFSDINFAGPGSNREKGTLSPTAVEYLKKLAALCEENNIKLILVSPPVDAGSKAETRGWAAMKKQIQFHGMEKIFAGYFENMIYLSREHFWDRLHLKDDFWKKNREKLRRKILPREVLEEIYRNK